MIRIALSPQLRSAPLAVEIAGETLIVNGEAFDFSLLPEGQILPASAIESDLFLDPIRRIGGDLYITMVLPHGPEAPIETRFPAEIINPPDGPLLLPPFGPDTGALS